MEEKCVSREIVLINPVNIVQMAIIKTFPLITPLLNLIPLSKSVKIVFNLFIIATCSGGMLHLSPFLVLCVER